MELTPEESSKLWGALHAIGSDADDVPAVPHEIIAKLIKLGVVERKANGLPILTNYGRKCFKIMEAGDNVRVLDLFPADKNNSPSAR